jgi:hypothetical protein
VVNVSNDPCEAKVGPLKIGIHHDHRAPLARPIIGLECRATVHVHWYTALANQ